VEVVATECTLLLRVDVDSSQIVVRQFIAQQSAIGGAAFGVVGAWYGVGGMQCEQRIRNGLWRWTRENGWRRQSDGNLVRFALK
jgi:hypothetical protein